MNISFSAREVEFAPEASIGDPIVLRFPPGNDVVSVVPAENGVVIASEGRPPYARHELQKRDIKGNQVWLAFPRRRDSFHVRQPDDGAIVRGDGTVIPTGAPLWQAREFDDGRIAVITRDPSGVGRNLKVYRPDGTVDWIAPPIPELPGITYEFLSINERGNLESGASARFGKKVEFDSSGRVIRISPYR